MTEPIDPDAAKGAPSTKLGEGGQGLLPPILLGMCLLLALAIVILVAVAVQRWIDARRHAHAEARIAASPPTDAQRPASCATTQRGDELAYHG